MGWEMVNGVMEGPGVSKGPEEPKSPGIAVVLGHLRVPGCLWVLWQLRGLGCTKVLGCSRVPERPKARGWVLGPGVPEGALGGVGRSPYTCPMLGTSHLLTPRGFIPCYLWDIRAKIMHKVIIYTF